ncbi:MAG TPA: hypothetical protein VF704_02000 [Allosphingosinicella sp.]|jgi:hypothetical protein
MASILLAALFAAASPANAAASAPSLDLRCFQLMAELAESDDPRLRSTGQVAAQYFLGRIDASAPDTQLQSPPLISGGERHTLLARCGAEMGAAGRDFRAIGEALVPGTRPAA